MGAIIVSVDPESIAEDLGWLPGDEIVSINGQSLHDIIDYRFHSADELLTVTVRHGEDTVDFEIEKDSYTPLGVYFEDDLFDGVRTCGAHCIFCFVEQLPPGLREPLYLKDDDYRLSFLHGNFVTLANATDEDLARIVTQRLSPLYISVHATDTALRERMLGREAPDILSQIDTLAKGRITVHAQIVLCRGINDGRQLKRTVFELAERHPTVASIAIVPAAVSKHRTNQEPIGAIDAQFSSELLRKILHWQKLFRYEKGTRLVWASDEFYLNAGKKVPTGNVYEGFSQMENGVGLVRRFKNSDHGSRTLLPRSLSFPLTVSLVTGVLAERLVKEWAESLHCKNLALQVFPIRNHLFGETVTVAGLLAGKDVISQLRGKALGDALVFPSVALRDEAFVDDVTVSDVRDALGCRVEVTEPVPRQLIRLILRIADENSARRD